jgi:hypothetical protein
MDPSGEKSVPAALTGVLAGVRLGGLSLSALSDDALRLTRQLRGCLEADLATHCLWAVAHGDLLCVVTDSPGWATRFRFMQVTLLETASASADRPLRQFRVMVAPPSSGGPFQFS